MDKFLGLNRSSVKRMSCEPMVQLLRKLPKKFQECGCSFKTLEVQASVKDLRSLRTKNRRFRLHLLFLHMLLLVLVLPFLFIIILVLLLPLLVLLLISQPR
jgi:hypothetical protein